MSAAAKHPLTGGFGPPPPLPEPVTGERLLARLWWAQRRPLAAGITAGVAWMTMQALIPVALGRAIDLGIRGGSWAAFSAWCAGVALLFIAESVLWVVRHRFAVGIWTRTMVWLHRTIASRALDPRGGLDAATTPGDVVSLVALDCRRVASLIDISCRGAGSVVTFIGVVAAMFVFSWQLALVVIGGLLPLLWLLLHFLHELERRAYRQQQTLGEASAFAADSIGALRVVKGVGAEPVITGRYSDRADGIAAAALNAAHVRARTLALDLVMSGSVIAVIAWFGGRLVLSGQLTVGALVTFSGWSIFLVVPLMTFNELGRNWAMGRSAARRIASALSLPRAFEEPPEGTAIPVAHGGVLRVAGVSLSRDGELLVSRLELEVGAGQFVAVVTDAKTAAALAGLLSRETAPDAGKVTLGGVDLRALSLQASRALAVVAEHDATLFPGSLRRNLAIARGDADSESMLAALEVAAAQDIVHALRGGLDGLVSERGRSLSGGERQRVALARALLADPSVLVLIDPTSALDAYTEVAIAERLRPARAGRATLVITSRPALLDIADDVVVLENGAVSLRGSHRQLLDSNPTYRSRFALLSESVEEAI